MDVKIGSLKGRLLTMVAQERDTSPSKHSREGRGGAGLGEDGWRDRDQDEQVQMSKVRQRTDRLVSEEERTRVGRGVIGRRRSKGEEDLTEVSIRSSRQRLRVSKAVSRGGGCKICRDTVRRRAMGLRRGERTLGKGPEKEEGSYRK